MQNVVYVIGAGFSAPLGLPLISDFIVKAKDQFFSDPDRYSHFQEVFDRISALAVTKNYFAADLFDIEEVLSILEMGDTFSGTFSKEAFTRFLADVIAYYTPDWTGASRSHVNWVGSAFGGTPLAANYGFFLADLCGIQLSRSEAQGGQIFTCSAVPEPTNRYGVITLNYDRVLENLWDHVAANYEVAGPLGLTRDPSEKAVGRALIAKLHGSIDTGDMVPPTWSKGMQESIRGAWRLAFDMLQNANHIRIMGYSLPEADAYVRYLLKAALTKSKHLKTIDVVCLDPDGSARARYDSFITFNYYKFTNMNVERYLMTQRDYAIGKGGTAHQVGVLEKTHHGFFG